jgi:hypothetical protein
VSYESLTSCAAQQAILDLCTTNPQLYAELTSGNHPPPPGSAVEDATPKAGNVVEDEDGDCMVDEVYAHVLNVCTAGKADQPLGSMGEFEQEDSEEFSLTEPVLLPTAPAKAPAPRRSSRLRGSNYTG